MSNIHGAPPRSGSRAHRMNFLPRCLYAILAIPTVIAQLARMQVGLDPDQSSDLSGGLGGQALSTKQSGTLTAAVSGCLSPVTLAQVGFDGSDSAALEVMRNGNRAALHPSWLRWRTD